VSYRKFAITSFIQMKMRRTHDQEILSEQNSKMNIESSTTKAKVHNLPLPLPRKIILFVALLIIVLVVYTTISPSYISTSSNPLASSASNTLRTVESGTSKVNVAKKALEIKGVHYFDNGGVRIEEAITKVGKDKTEMSYYHCGPRHTPDTIDQRIEILLLHGAAFTKKNWLKSGLLQRLCTERGNEVSVTAVDLDHRSDGEGLYDLFIGLTVDKVISGNSLTIITPSASGKSVVSLAESVSTSTHLAKEHLNDMLHVWIPVASGSVLDATEDAINVFQKLNIPVLAFNGDDDEKGKQVTKRLVELANAEEAEIKGGHPCYFDSPDDFIIILFEFLERMPRP